MTKSLSWQADATAAKEIFKLKSTRAPSPLYQGTPGSSMSDLWGTGADNYCAVHITSVRPSELVMMSNPHHRILRASTYSYAAICNHLDLQD